MKLATFITSELDAILEEWERFARTLQPTMDSLALRDHAREILEAIAKDIVLPQTAVESDEKSQGTEDSHADIDTAAAVHGTLRHDAGFDLPQLFGEYRALRASVLRMWSEQGGDSSRDGLYQATRFNEAIDQALAESVARFSDDMDRARNTFIVVLGDDLRAPLQAMSASATALAATPVSSAVQADSIGRIRASVLAMNRTIGDLLEYTRTRLGKTIPIKAERANVEAIVRQSLAEIVAGYPQRSFRVETGKDLVTSVDSIRLQQAISNLLSNAIEHGRQGSIIDVIAQKEAGCVAIEVSNEGPTIPPDLLEVIFDPLAHVAAVKSGTGVEERLGLGLFVAREIALGHGGSIEARSENRRTTFTIRIPLEAKVQPPAAARVASVA